MTSSEDVVAADLYADLFHAAPTALLTLRVCDLVMVDANRAYLEMVHRSAEEVIGRPVFEVFPDSPTNPDATQSETVGALFRRAIETKTPAEARGMRYDIPAPGGGFEARWWNSVDAPILGTDGEVEFLLHVAEDVTELHRTREELAHSRESQRRSAAQVASLAEVALALTSAQSVEDLEQIVVGQGLSVLGSDGGGVISRVGPERSDGWRMTMSPTLVPHRAEKVSHVDYDDPLPAVQAARTGRRILLGNRAVGLAASPSMQEVYDESRRDAWACLPLVSRGRSLGCLGVAWVEERAFTATELSVMEGFAAQCATALDRIVEAERQRRTAERVRHLAEALQRSMLTPPPQSDAVELAVRYRPANDVAQVGGDWYDAFVQPGGDVMVVIGDVSGHDDDAAGKMGQVRGLLRAVAYDDREVQESPAAVLTRFEHAARGLRVDELATAVLARIDAATGPDGRRRLRWSNAGNPPPVVVAPDGTAALLLDGRADLILGVDPDTPRQDHEVEVAPGTTLLFYTDGLIERRDVSIDRGLDDLQAVLAGLVAMPLEELCDTVLASLDPHVGEDDIAMVAVRV